MIYFNEQQSEVINRMWIRVRCFNIKNVPIAVWILLIVVFAGAGFLMARSRKLKKEI